MNLKQGLRKNQDDSFAAKDGGFSPTCFAIPDGVEMYRPKAGTNKIDILPFIRKDGDPAYLLEYYQHTGVGLNNNREICLAKTFGKPCPICAERQRMINDGGSWQDDNVKALSPKRRCLYNVIDLLEPEKGVQLFEVSHFLFEKNMISDARDEDPDMVFADLEDGRTVAFKGRESEFNGKSSVNKFDSFTFLPRKPYKASILDSVIKLDAILTPKNADQLAAEFYCNPDASDVEEPTITTEADLPFPDKRAEDVQPVKATPKAKKKVVGTCPVEGAFGLEFDLYEQCDDCAVRKDCEAAHE